MQDRLKTRGGTQTLLPTSRERERDMENEEVFGWGGVCLPVFVRMII